MVVSFDDALTARLFATILRIELLDDKTVVVVGTEGDWHFSIENDLSPRELYARLFVLARSLHHA